jgi:AAA15 family ATPase/GTPase
MLVEFRVENHRSIREEQVFTMEAGRVGDATDIRPRHVQGSSHPLLPVAAIYGANASGKSNILDGLAYMQVVVLLSYRFFSPGSGIPGRTPFAWDEHRGKPSLYEVVLIIDGVRYQYGFALDDERIHEEWLYAWPKGRKQRWFEREWNDEEGYSFLFGDHLKGVKRIVEDFTRDNALFLSAAAQNANEQLTPLYNWFQGLRVVESKQRVGFSDKEKDKWLATAMQESVQPGVSQESRLQSKLEAFRDLIRAADFGVVDFKLDPNKPGSYLLQHSVNDHDPWLALDQESDGTKALFSRAQLIIDVIWRGGIIVIDELEKSLHPLLAQRMIDLFNDPLGNPLNAQIIFTTHDTNLLSGLRSSVPLRRDQVWLTEKSREGATHLFPLTNYRPRKGENLEKSYLIGRYGGIPIATDFARSSWPLRSSKDEVVADAK